MRNRIFIFSLLIALFASASSFGQIVEAKWDYGFVQKTAKVGDVVDLYVEGTPPKGWHIYSTHNECEVGPTVAELVLTKNETFELVGGLKGIGEHSKVDEDFECTVYVFDHKAKFIQKVKILSENPQIKGYLLGQMCSDQCVQFDLPDWTFSGIKINAGGAAPVKKTDEPVDEIEPSEEPDPAVDTTNNTSVDTTENTNTEENVASSTPSYRSTDGKAGECIPKVFDGEGNQDTGGESYWGLFIVAFLSGLAGLVTPCVFPMIPMTVSFFMKDKKGKAGAIRDGLLFGTSIVLIYTVIGTIVALAFGASFANWISTHWIPNVMFFIIFMVFAASFFGAFEITLPSWLVNKMDAKADKGGLMGTFFMAFTIVLVSFSCTGPIVGTILVETVQGGVMRPIVGMLGFGLAFALPFGLFAVFPQWLNNLPKSGGWLNTVKVVLGFIELALGLKFLSVADLTYHWGILDREVYLALWIVIFFLLGVYLLGKLKFAHDSEMPFLKVPRLILAICTFSFVVYLIPGLWGAPLKAISGYLPPMHTQDFNIDRSIKEAVGVPEGLCTKPSFQGDLHIPLDLPGYFDYDEAVACAKEQGKPLFLDFTGHGCPNCRKFENEVWSDPKVYRLLKDNFVIASLYVDDKKAKLPEDDHYISRFNGRKVTTLAQKNSDIEKCYFNQNTQPLYVVMDGKENLMAPARSTDYNGKRYDSEEFAEYLEKAIEKFNKTNPE